MKGKRVLVTGGAGLQHKNGKSDDDKRAGSVASADFWQRIKASAQGAKNRRRS